MALKRKDEMKMETLKSTLETIGGLDAEAMQQAQAHIDQLTKPPGSLGKLEQLAIRLAGMTGRFPLAERTKAIVVMAGDHGVCEEGVSAFPQEVTPQMVLNFLHGGAAVNVLGRHVGADVICVDIGVKGEVAHERLWRRKIRPGTGNMALGPAMTREEAVAAIETGIEVVRQLAAQGYGVFATGEMGIGNTTPSAAMLSVLGGLPPEQTVGRGTGIGDEALARKRLVVERAIALNKPDADDPIDVLAKVGGLEIAGLIGVVLGAASCRCPVVIDGYIATVAALAACRLHPPANAFIVASHLSEEPGHRAALQLLGAEPMLLLNMRLGEGTGAALAMSLLDAAVKIANEMATFESAGVSK
jgi:nicotinate-nucleotide--dimethylbenzimidazole phosphoribosyltransferase